VQLVDVVVPQPSLVPPSQKPILQYMTNRLLHCPIRHRLSVQLPAGQPGDPQAADRIVSVVHLGLASSFSSLLLRFPCFLQQDPLPFQLLPLLISLSLPSQLPLKFLLSSQWDNRLLLLSLLRHTFL
ncbi:MAG: hypothetical protein ACK56I_32735, partial [bacterium]